VNKITQIPAPQLDSFVNYDVFGVIAMERRRIKIIDSYGHY